MAVGASDQYVRIYDRRTLGPGAARPFHHAAGWCHVVVLLKPVLSAHAGRPGSPAVHAEPLLMLAPPHLCLGNAPFPLFP